MPAINLSGTTLMDDSFAAYLQRQFAEHAILRTSVAADRRPDPSLQPVAHEPEPGRVTFR